MRWSNCTVSVFSKKLRHSGVSKNKRARPARTRRRSAARCCRCSRRAARRPARRDRFARAPGQASRAPRTRMRGGARLRAGRSLEPLRGPDHRDIDHAGEHEMRRQPILRDFDRVSARPEATIHQPTAPCSAPRPKMNHSRPRKPGRPSRATGTTETAAGTRRRSARPSSRCVHSHQINRLERVEAHALVELAVLRNGLIFLEFGLPLRSRRAAARRP